MSLRKLSVRLIDDEEVTGGVRAVDFYGHTVTEDFSTIEVEDDVAAKALGNPCIEVREPKGKATQAAAVQPDEPKPEA